MSEHECRWSEVSRRFQKPPTSFDLKGPPNQNQELIVKMTYGFTTIEQRCPICYTIRFIEALGDNT